ncbi:MAG TPA: hypothetical protein DEP27_01390 [Ruminococcaceae bacterium]|nr:hypothetical protein [Oscillospiraceae bacterium]
MHKAGKTLIVLGTVFTVGLGTAGTVMATTQNAVVTKDGQAKKVYMLTDNDTNNILKTAGVKTSRGDMILRSTSSQGNIEVNVRTAYPVVVKADGTKKSVTAHYGDTARDILAARGIILGPVDTVNVPLNRPVEENTQIRVIRNHIVTVKADGVSTQVIACTDATAEQIVQKAGVTVKADDELSTASNRPVAGNQPITVNRVTYQDQVISEAIPFKTVTQNDDTMLVGETKVKTEGSEGQNKIVRRTKYINGAAQETTVVSTDVVKKATDRVVLQGSKEPQPKETTDTEENATEPPKVSSSDAANPQPSSSSKSRQIDGYSYSRMLSGPCTAYTGGGVTASGMSAAVGRVAVDPSVIPYGTHLYITSADGSYVYGYAVAADTGGFVSNSSTMIDLYMSSKAECSAFGRQTMNIYILD